MLARVCSPKKPKQQIIPPTPAPEVVDPAVQQTVQRERRRARTRYGLAATNLTGGFATPVTANQKTLLGA